MCKFVNRFVAKKPSVLPRLAFTIMEIKNNEKIIEKTRKVKVFREFVRIYDVGEISSARMCFS